MSSDTDKGKLEIRLKAHRKRIREGGKELAHISHMTENLCQ